MKLAFFLAGLFSYGANSAATMCLPSDLGCMELTIVGYSTSSFKYDCDADGAWQTTTYAGVDDCSGSGVAVAGIDGDTASYETCGDDCENYFTLSLNAYATTDCTGDVLMTMDMVEGFDEDAGACDGPDEDGVYSTGQCVGTTSVKTTDYTDSECSEGAESETYGVGDCIEIDGGSMKPTALDCQMPSDEPTTPDESANSKCLPSNLGCMSYTQSGEAIYSVKYDCAANGAWETTEYEGDCTETGTVSPGVDGDTTSYETCGNDCEDYFTISVNVYLAAHCAGDVYMTMDMATGFDEDAGACDGPDDDGLYSKGQCVGTDKVKETTYTDSECSAGAVESTYAVGSCIEFDEGSMEPTALYCKSAANKIGVIAVFVLCAMATLFN